MAFNLLIGSFDDPQGDILQIPYLYGKVDVEFEWDPLKEQANVIKHGHNFSEAVETFKDPKGVRLIDPKHSGHEMRFYWIGKVPSGKILTVRFTQRGNMIRIIGCAEWRKFRSIYYEAAKTE